MICDNASTDRTPEICARYAHDGRLRFVQFNENVGAAENFNRVFRLSEADLFCWAACDDRMRPGFLRASVDALIANADAAICVTPVRFIDAKGSPMGFWPVDDGLASPILAVRLQRYLHRPGWHVIYNMMRRAALDETALFPHITGGDVILVWSILLRHPVCVVHSPLLEYRVTPKTPEGLAETVAPHAPATFYRFGHCQMWREMWHLAGRLELPAPDRATARRALCRWLLSRHWRPLLFRDLYAELRYSMGRRRPIRSMVVVVAMFVLRPAHAASKAGRGLQEIMNLRQRRRYGA
jgi:glycosyltransferase involved in cell wall biosynthesis